MSVKHLPWVARAAVVLGVVVDGIFVWQVFCRHGATNPSALSSHLLPWFAAHAVACLFAGTGLVVLSPRKGRAFGRGIFFIASALLVPIVGIVGPWVVVVCGLRLPKPASPFDVLRFVGPPDLPERGSDNPEPPRLGAASAYGLLRHSQRITDRMAAVMAVRAMSGRSSVPVLKLALRDPADEVRLLAFTILQERERELYAEIHDLQRTQEAVAARSSRANASLGQKYWELAYQDLVQGELLVFALDEAAKYLALAVEQEPTNAGNTLLLGRVRLRQGRGREAAQLLAKAGQLGLPNHIVNVHRAEAAFVERRFDEVRRYLAAIPDQARLRPVVQALVEYWT
jgi:hypothetical protein